MLAANTTIAFLIAMIIIFTLPYLIWRIGISRDYFPFVVIQIVTGIFLGPGMLGAVYTEYYEFVFNSYVVQSLNGIAWWAVMLFVWISGVELDINKVWANKWESGTTAGLALGVPLILGCCAAAGMSMYPGWVGEKGEYWQFMVGIGMACAVTALPILILFLENMELLRQPIGERILRYASMDDLAIWLVLAIVLADLQRLGNQLCFLLGYLFVSILFRKFMLKCKEIDRWFIGLIWLTLCGFGAEWSGLHFMVGAFLAGFVMDRSWFEQQKMDYLRQHILMTIMPVFFLSTGLRADWNIETESILLVTAMLLIASVGGKLLGVHIAGRVLMWKPGEASFIGWLLQTKALIMIIFANILLDREIITAETFTALLLMAVCSTALTMPIASSLMIAKKV